MKALHLLYIIREKLEAILQKYPVLYGIHSEWALPIVIIRRRANIYLVQDAII